VFHGLFCLQRVLRVALLAGSNDIVLKGKGVGVPSRLSWILAVKSVPYWWVMRRLELMSHNLLLRSPRTLWQQAPFPEVHFVDQQADHATRAARPPHDFLFAHLPPLHIPQRESAYQMPQMRQGQALAGLKDMLKSAPKRVGNFQAFA
jgi:hypothetical protein